jgi:hypothetical protein
MNYLRIHPQPCGCPFCGCQRKYEESIKRQTLPLTPSAKEALTAFQEISKHLLFQGNPRISAQVWDAAETLAQYFEPIAQGFEKQSADGSETR